MIRHTPRSPKAAALLLLAGGLLTSACGQPSASGRPGASVNPNAPPAETIPVETVFDEGPLDDVNSDNTPATTAAP